MAARGRLAGQYRRYSLLMLEPADGAADEELDAELGVPDSPPDAAFVSDLISVFESDFDSVFLSALSPLGAASALDELLFDA
jgi:hypothetical protein